MAAEEEPWHICLVLVRTRRRAGRPLRVIHRKDIVRCESTREVIQERGEDHA
jgi:hypothetical protein